jgi:general secretion pathway protein K
MVQRAQHGVALITALFIVVFGVGISALLAINSTVWSHQVINHYDSSQASLYRRGAVSFASWLLLDDISRNQIDHYSEEIFEVRTLPTTEGSINLLVKDAQSTFNINNLINNGNVDLKSVQFYRRLLTILKLDETLSEALIDWLDKDSQVRPGGGAEDLDYINSNSPYRAANALIESIDELRLIKGYDSEVLETLRPYISALPLRTAVNVNTASAEIIAAMFPSMPITSAKQAVLDREKQPFKQISDLLRYFPKDIEAPEISYGFNSSFFYIHIDVTVRKIDQRSTALLHRKDNKNIELLWHQPRFPRLKTDADA